MKKNIRIRCYIAGIVVLIAAIAATVICGLRSATVSAAVPVPGEIQPRIHTVEVTKEVERVVETEKVITAEMLQEGLNDMGLLVTQEYWFTEVVNYSDTLKFAKTGWKIPGTESGFIISYDGVVTAGVDFGGIRVEKDDEAMTVTVHIPETRIHNVTIDHDSFTLHSEKKNVLNPLSVEDFNDSLVTLEGKARDQAIEKGILTRGNENARAVIANFVGSLVNTALYRVTCVTV